jgi:hypothetical protein
MKLTEVEKLVVVASEVGNSVEGTVCDKDNAPHVLHVFRCLASCSSSLGKRVGSIGGLHS